MNDWYRTATELYTNSLRALEQRSTAFLFTQSLLVGAFVILLVSFQPNNIGLFVTTLGIALIGLAFSLLFYFNHLITSKDAAYWRAYMRFLEKKFSRIIDDISIKERPWHLFYEYIEKIERKEPKGSWARICYRISRLWSWENAAKKWPAPILWLAAPAIFCIAWIWALLCAIQLYYPCFTQVCVGFWPIGLALSFLISTITIYRWCKAKDNICNEINQLATKLTETQ